MRMKKVEKYFFANSGHGGVIRANVQKKRVFLRITLFGHKYHGI